MVMTINDKKHRRLLFQEAREQLKLQALQKKLCFAKNDVWGLEKDVNKQKKIKSDLQLRIKKLEKVM